MKILLLGGTGAIGRPLVKRLAEHENNKITVTTRAAYTSTKNVQYIQGNAHEKCFVERICKQKYDAIVDFMVYETEEFQTLSQLLLGATNQYIFMSSARVYAESSEKLTEDSERLLDTIKDKKYLATNEYALKKARQENILINSKAKNWTIIRPYITYNTNRLQLGTLEKEFWLRRALQGKTVVLTKETAEAYTSLTYGEDVSEYLEKIVGNKNCIGKIYHIVNEESKKWKEVLGIYNRVFEKKTGNPFRYIITDEYQAIGVALGTTYQMKYDRFYNRSFDCSRVRNDCSYSSTFTDMEYGIALCLETFLENPHFNPEVNWKYEGLMDRLSKEKISLTKVPGIKNKIKYFMWRNIPCFVMRFIEETKNILVAI